MDLSPAVRACMIPENEGLVTQYLGLVSIYSCGIPRAECQTRAIWAELSFVINSVHDSIGPKNDLANVVVPVFGNDATQLWQFLQPVCRGN